MLKNLFTKFAANTEEPKPSQEPVDGKIRYKFSNGLECRQEELTLGQDEKLVEIMMGLELSGVDLENTKLRDIISQLLSENLLYKMLQVVLIAEHTDKDFTRGGINIDRLRSLKNSELEAVIKDFFSLNPTARDWLKTIGSGLISGQTTTGISNS